jgi:D-inositol-3-phosphate glycosyltransferase
MTNIMRIAFILYHTCPLALQEGLEAGGANIYVYEAAKALADLGIKVDAYTRSQASDNPEIVEVSENFRVIHLKAGPQADLDRKTVKESIPLFVDSFFEFTSRENLQYDLFDCHYYLSGIVAAQINTRLEKKLPTLQSFHTLALLKNLVARTKFEKESIERVYAEKDLVNNADLLIVPSENEKQYLKYFYEANESKTRVLIPGVNKSIFYPIDQNEAKEKIGANTDHKILMFVGRIKPLKGLDQLIYALKILKQKGMSQLPCLWIVGGDSKDDKEDVVEEIKNLKTLINFLELDSFVKFTSQKTQEELLYYYNAADILVMPSHYESFGMVSLEAMSCGTPVITTNVTGVSHLIEDSDLLTSVNNPLDLAEKIKNLLEDDEYRSELSMDVVHATKDYSWENLGKQLIKEYEDLLK